MKMRTIGIDGCRAGWLGVSLDQREEYFWLIESDIELRHLFETFDCVFIDIPIGLQENMASRTCDDLLRRVLGSNYHSSVFSPPVRSALLTNEYKVACDINEAKTGKRISIQSWNITPKIIAVDTILQENRNLSKSVLESHPELLFKKLNRGKESLDKKKTDSGLEQRLALLNNEYPGSANLYQKIRSRFLKKQVADDDITDALVLAYFASKAPDKPIRTLPLPAEVDSTGLPMAIHFV